MNHVFPKIIKAGFIVGTLDILSAFIHYFIKTGETHFFQVFKFIASGIFGAAAFSGGKRVILAGFILHYIIAFIFSILFFWLFPKIRVAAQNKILTGIIYGGFVWAVMNLIVVPLSNVPHRSFAMANAIINVIILIICVGIPLSFMANAYYNSLAKRQINVTSPTEF